MENKFSILRKVTAPVWPVQNDSIKAHTEASLSFSLWLLVYSYLLYLSFSPSPGLSSSDWCQLMSEPAYGFVLFDYITGNLEGQADKSQLL